MPDITSETDPYIGGTQQYHRGDACVRSHALRLAARRAMVDCDNAEKVKRALEHRTRVSTTFEVGQHVFYWRPIKHKDADKRGSWFGPARVIGFYDNSRIWITHGNKVLRCSPEQLRGLTVDQEALFVLYPLKYCRNLENMQNVGHKHFLTSREKRDRLMMSSHLNLELSTRPFENQREEGRTRKQRPSRWTRRNKSKNHQAT